MTTRIRQFRNELARGAHSAPLAADSFNRANSTSLGVTDGLLVGRPGGAGRSWAETNGDWQVTGNKIGTTGSNPSEAGKFVAALDLGVPDAIVQVRLDISGHTKGPAARIAGLNSFVFAFIRDSDNTLKIADNQAGVISALASTTITPGTNDLLLFAVIGSKLVAMHQNGSTGAITSVTATSTYNQTQTKHGLRCDLTGGVFDHFAALPACLPIRPFPM